MANKSAQESSAALNLLSQLEKGTTGRLTVGKGAARVAVYVRTGGVMAAEAADDVQHILRRLRVQEDLPAPRADELKAMDDLGEPVLDVLFQEVDDDAMDVVLHERFRDNVARYLASEDKPRFKKKTVIFVENVQIGVDPGRLLAECARMADDAGTLDFDAVLLPGTPRSDDGFAAIVLERLGEGNTVADLLAELPVEPIWGRAQLARLLRDGALRLESGEAEPAPEPVVEDEEPSLPEDFEDDLEIEPPTEEQAGDSEGVGDLSSLDAWMGHGEELDDELLDAFADHDYDRGSAAQGGGSAEEAAFSGATTQTMDRVEVDEVPEEPAAEEEEEEVLAAGEAPQARYSAPVLSEEDALQKLEVANECLRAMSSALDEVEGSGAGRAALQLLVDGAPARFADLFVEVQVTDQGELPPDDILDNLAERPPTEHRALLNKALVDVIERGLSSVGDELPDEQFDTMYEKVSGYRQRMGL